MGLALTSAAHHVRSTPRSGSSESGSLAAMLAPPSRRSTPRALFRANEQRKFDAGPRNDDPAAPCSPSLAGTPGAEMNEGTLESRLPLRASGTLRAVMLFVDFARPAGGRIDCEARQASRTACRRLAVGSLLSPSRARGHARPPLVPAFARDAGLRARRRSQLRRATRLIAEAVASADHDVDFSPYKIVYVVLSQGSSLERSPAFHAFPGDGIRVDGTELRYGATFGDDVRGGSRGYAAHVLVHETGHIFGLPDLVRRSPSGLLAPFALRGWLGHDELDRSRRALSRLAQVELGWLEPSQLTCLEAGGRLTTSLSPLERVGGLRRSCSTGPRPHT